MDTLLNSEQTWRVLQGHRRHWTLTDEGRPWDETIEPVRAKLAEDGQISVQDLATILEVEPNQVEVYLRNIEGRAQFGENRIKGWQSIVVLAVGVLLSFLIFVFLVQAAPKKIQGEGSTLKEGNVPADRALTQ